MIAREAALDAACRRVPGAAMLLAQAGRMSPDERRRHLFACGLCRRTVAAIRAEWRAVVGMDELADEVGGAVARAAAFDVIG